jgi:hypothetical protein
MPSGPRERKPRSVHVPAGDASWLDRSRAIRRQAGMPRTLPCYVFIILTSASGLTTPAGAWIASVAEGDARTALIDPGGDVVAGGMLRVGNAPPRMFVTRRNGATGAERWHVELNRTDGTLGGCTNFCSANHLARTADGDVIVGGILAGPGEPPTLLRLDGATGAPEWIRPLLSPHTPSNGTVQSLVLDAASNPVVAGSLLYGPGGDFDYFVAKVDVTTGTELWRFAGQGSADGAFPGTDDRANGVAIDPAGDVVTVASVSNPGTGRDVDVVKLTGAGGALVWRITIAIPGTGSDFGVGIATDAAADVYAVGHSSQPGGRTIVVAKLDGDTGAELWRRQIAGGESIGDTPQPARIRVDAAGNVLIADAMIDPVAGRGFAAMKLSGATGDEMWTTRRSGGSAVGGAALALAIEPDGTVVAVGWLEVPPDVFGEPDREWLVLKLDPDDGNVLAEHRLDGADDEGEAIGVAAGAGRTAVAGNLWDEDGPAFTILHFAEALDGRRLVVRDRDSRDRLILKSTDRRFLAAAPGTAGDPTLHGGALTVRNPISGESATFPLPAAGWRAQHGRPAGQHQYVYRGSRAAGSPCTQVTIKSAKVLTAKCGDLGPLDLDEPSQGALELRLVTGTGGGRYCARFSHPTTDVPGSFTANAEIAPSDCP